MTLPKIFLFLSTLETPLTLQINVCKNCLVDEEVIVATEAYFEELEYCWSKCIKLKGAILRNKFKKVKKCIFLANKYTYQTALVLRCTRKN